MGRGRVCRAEAPVPSQRQSTLSPCHPQTRGAGGQPGGPSTGIPRGPQGVPAALAICALPWRVPSRLGGGVSASRPGHGYPLSTWLGTSRGSPVSGLAQSEGVWRPAAACECVCPGSSVCSDPEPAGWHLGCVCPRVHSWNQRPQNGASWMQPPSSRFRLEGELESSGLFAGVLGIAGTLHGPSLLS